jgi:electron transfer flavoprotein beta subunit
VKILVFIKQVPESEARVSIGEGGKGFQVEERWEIGYFDAMALEEAIRIKERLGDGEVVVASVGERKAVETLRTAIAMGADRASLIEWDGLSFAHPLSVSRLLATFAQKEGFDLIFCGKKALDDENGCVANMVSLLLGIPLVPNVSRIESISGKTAVVLSERERKRLLLEVTLPAVFTAEKGLNEPRIPSVSSAIKALGKEIPVVGAYSLVPEETLVWESKGVSPVLFEGPQPRPRVELIEGTAAQKVDRLLEVLKREGVL